MRWKVSSNFKWAVGAFITTPPTPPKKKSLDQKFAKMLRVKFFHVRRVLSTLFVCDNMKNPRVLENGKSESLTLQQFCQNFFATGLLNVNFGLLWSTISCELFDSNRLAMMFHCQTFGWSFMLLWQITVLCCSVEMYEQSMAPEVVSGAIYSRKQLLHDLELC